jgi:hypothetical protein
VRRLDDGGARGGRYPTAAPMSFQLNDWYTADFHGLDDTANQVVFRAVIPFFLGGTQNIVRVTQPYSTSAGAGRQPREYCGIPGKARPSRYHPHCRGGGRESRLPQTGSGGAMAHSPSREWLRMVHESVSHRA